MGKKVEKVKKVAKKAAKSVAANTPEWILDEPDEKNRLQLRKNRGTHVPPKEQKSPARAERSAAPSTPADRGGDSNRRPPADFNSPDLLTQGLRKMNGGRGAQIMPSADEVLHYDRQGTTPPTRYMND